MSAPANELMHALVLREMKQGIRRDGLWAQALREAGGDTSQAQAIYIGLRVTSLQQETTQLLVQNIKGAVADQLKRPADFLSAKNLPKPSR